MVSGAAEVGGARERPLRAPRQGSLLVSVLDALTCLGPGPQHVLDVGGGTGGLAVPLAQAGHAVTVVDPSPDALAALERRAAEAGVAAMVTALQGDLDGLSRLAPSGGADAVLCHRLLERVEDRAAAMAAVAGATRPGGLVSVLAANRLALVLQRAVAGRLAGLAGLLTAVPAPGPLDRRELVALAGDAGLLVTTVAGVRVLSDLVPGALLDDPHSATALRALEEAAAEHPALREVASQLHLLARRP